MEEHNNSNGPAPVKPVTEPPATPPERERDLTFKIKRRHLRALGVIMLMILAYMLGSFTATARMYRRGRAPVFDMKLPSIEIEIPSYDLKASQKHIDDFEKKLKEFEKNLREEIEGIEDSVRDGAGRYFNKRWR